jgi:hypothetical protein
VRSSSTITSDGKGDVCASTDPETGGGHGSPVAVVVGATVVADASVVVVALRVDVVARSVVLLAAVPVSSSPLQPATTTTTANARRNEAVLRTQAR